VRSGLRDELAEAHLEAAAKQHQEAEIEEHHDHAEYRRGPVEFAKAARSGAGPGSADVHRGESHGDHGVGDSQREIRIRTRRRQLHHDVIGHGAAMAIPSQVNCMVLFLGMLTAAYRITCTPARMKMTKWICLCLPATITSAADEPPKDAPAWKPLLVSTYRNSTST
jgi:hypothetical protein